MDPTIYTFGDPFIVREALLALATIFGAGEWVDAGNGFGLGGNFLAAALIGLLGILIAGINTQAMRIDYLLTAFIIFAIAFSVTTDVNVEDIQTGDASVVANVPIGVAYIASLSSSAAYSITETVSTALQRPGSPTSVLGDEGFMNPLKELLQMRNIELKELDPYLYETILSYYRFCVGKTEQNDPTVWRMNNYLIAPNPWEFFVTIANVQNWTTIYYDDAVPGGEARACHDVAPVMDNRMAEITGGTTDEALRYLRGAMGPEQYNIAYEMTSIESAVDLLFRSTLTSQQYMANAMLTNLHNEGEAWKIAEYGSNKAQYVATLTEAFETKAVQATTEGSIFLQYMFPLMGFIQFLFFMLPPIIAFMIIASPFQAPKLIGSYALLGVAAYGWLPIAAVINHYMQIAMANEIQYAGLDLVASGHTAITGFNSLYNSLATRLVIGSNALAASPIILAAILTMAPASIAKLAGNFSGGGSVNTSIASPKLAENGPVLKKAALAAAGVGATIANGGSFIQASSGEKAAFGTLSVGRSLSSAAGTQQSYVDSLRKTNASRVSKVAGTVQSIVASGEIETGQRATRESAKTEAVSAAWDKNHSKLEQLNLSASSQHRAMAQASAAIFNNGISDSSVDTSNLTKQETAAVNMLMTEKDSIVASAAEKLSTRGGVEEEVGDRLAQNASDIEESSLQAENAQAFADELKRSAGQAQSVSRSHSMATTDIAQVIASRNRSPMGGIESEAARAGVLDEMKQRAAEIYAESNPVDLEGKRSPRENMNARISSALLALEELSGSDPEAAKAFVNVLSSQAGFALDPFTEESLADLSAGGRAAGALNTKREGLATDVANERKAAGDSINQRNARTDDLAGAISDLSGQRANQDAFDQDARARVSQARQEDRNGARGAQAGLQRSMEAARRERDRTATGKALNWASAESGFDERAFNTLNAVPSGYGEEAQQAAAGLVADLEGLAMGQKDINADPAGTYEEFISKGYSPKAAATAAMSEFGFRQSGAVDTLLFGGLLGASVSQSAAMGDEAAREAIQKAAKEGIEAGGKSQVGRAILKTLKFGGPAVGLTTSALMAWSYKRDEKELGGEWDRALQGEMMTAAKEMYGQGLEGGRKFQEFQGYLEENPVQNSQEMINAISTFFEGNVVYGSAAGEEIDIGSQGSEGYTPPNWQEQVDVLSDEIKK